MSTGNTTCKGESMTWAINDRGETPCKVYEDMINVCQNFEMFDTQLPPTVFTCTTSNPNSCCCSSVAFALFQACMLGVTSLPRTQNFSSWLDGCDNPQIGSLPNDVARNRSVSVPQWTFVSPQKSDEAWNITLALANATSLQPSSSVFTGTRLSTTARLASSQSGGSSSSSTQKKTSFLPTATSRTSSNVRSVISSTSITTSMDSPPQPVQTYSEVGEVMNGARKGGQTTGAVVGALGGTVLISIILVYLYKQKR
ncbi:hypothetical protein I203_108212 [Kwoniella mangroviensis CBS 8507]|uniref:hypothetical protein n=1 Tax=Kwoniella mangroviensis CBS 8507 TaxID=1296122 RepID=UPI00305122FB